MHHVLRLLDAAGPAKSAPAAEARVGPGTMRLLACAACGHPITTHADRILVAGAHEHDGTNPGGWTYRFGCFARATGCASQGVPSKQCTWFPGYWWHIQACGGCAHHLGWLFFQKDHEFYGLIVDRLIEHDAPAPN
jgi:hypothetical protein